MSANFRFLSRLSVIHVYFVQAVTDFLLPTETAVHAEIASCRNRLRDCASCRVFRDRPRVSGSCRDSHQEAQPRGQSQWEAIFSRTVVLGGSKRSQTVSAEAKYDDQSRQEAKIGEKIYALCSFYRKMKSFLC